jgi:porin
VGAHWKIPAFLAAVLTVTLGSSAGAEPIKDPTKPEPAAAEKPKDAPPSPWTFTTAYTADLLDDVQGGAERDLRYLHLLKLSAAYDGESGGHDGFSSLVSVEHFTGSSFTARKVGGLQDISGNEAPVAALRLDEAWVQQEILQGRGALKAGFISLNATFDVQETAALFLNGSHGVGPEFADTGLNGPSDYPTTAVAAVAVYRPNDDWTAQLGVFDGVAGDPKHPTAFVAVKLDGALIVGQVERRFGDTGRIQAGAWTYTAAFDSLDQFDGAGAALRTHGNSGAYGLVEGRLRGKPDGDEGGLSGWFRVGLANGDINTVESYVGAGLVYTGPFKGRDKDEAGVAIARAGLGSGARYVGALDGRRIGNAETTLEATYRYACRDWLNIQPDLQYVIHPHGDRDIRDALVVGVRIAVTISR